MEPGVTTEGQLKGDLGSPAATRTPSERPEARILEYPHGCSYQIERGILVAASCKPTGGQGTLQYWRHQWIGHAQKFEPLPDSQNAHGLRRFQLVSEQARMAVIYDEATERVVQVVRYGAR
jgi:hypothetical protein